MDNHKSLDEFEFRRNSTTDCGVICPGASEKSTYRLDSTLGPSFLIGSSFFQVTRTTTKSRMKLVKIRPDPILTAELAALVQKNLLLENYSKYFVD